LEQGRELGWLVAWAKRRRKVGGGPGLYRKGEEKRKSWPKKGRGISTFDLKDFEIRPGEDLDLIRRMI